MVAGALLDVSEVFPGPREVTLVGSPDRLLFVLFVNKPKTAGVFGRAFVVVKFPIEHKGAAPFDGGDQGLDALLVLLLWRVAPGRESVFADEDTFAGDAGLGLQFGLDVVESSVKIIADVALEAVVAGVADEIDLNLREDVVGEASATFEEGLDEVHLGIMPHFDVLMRRVAFRVVDGLLADFEPGNEVDAKVLGKGLFRVKVRPQMPVSLPVAEVERFPGAAVGAEQMRSEVAHFAILQIAISRLEGASVAMRSERIGPDEEVRKRHVEHRSMGRVPFSDFIERFQAELVLPHISLGLAKRSLFRDRKLHDARPKLRDEFGTLQQGFVLRELIPPADGLRAEDQVRWLRSK